MKNISRSNLYTVKNTDIKIPLDYIKNKCMFTIYKLKYFNNVKISLKYSTKEGKNTTLITIDCSILTDEYIISDYILKALESCTINNFENINKFFLSYSYDKS